MRKKQAETPPDPYSGRRKWPRKTALLNAIVIGADGKDASDCTIRDISAGGALISSSKSLQTGARVFLLNIDFETAYSAAVVWSKPDSCGLSFERKYAMDASLPQDLKFLWRIFLETKLKKVERYLGRGIPRGFALMDVNLTDTHLTHMRPYAQDDPKFAQLVKLATQLLDGERNAQAQSVRA